MSNVIQVKCPSLTCDMRYILYLRFCCGVGYTDGSVRSFYL